MPCDEWATLLDRYRRAVSSYDEAVNGLSALQDALFNAKWQQAEQARKQSDGCRADLLHHEHDHACLSAGRSEANAQRAAVSTEKMVLGDQGQSGG
jgi:hypothetical protein